MCVFLIYWLFLLFSGSSILLAPFKILLILLLSTIVADYLGLFIVRGCLTLTTRNLTLAILTSTIFAFLATTALFTFFYRVVEEWVMGWPPQLMETIEETIVEGWTSPYNRQIMAPAFLVYLWLPLFLIGGLLNSGLNAFFRTGGLAQRFIKHGDEHPLDAIGMVAAAIVFVATVILQVGTYFV
jgi:hypothetical protein